MIVDTQTLCRWAFMAVIAVALCGCERKPVASPDAVALPTEEKELSAQELFENNERTVFTLSYLEGKQPASRQITNFSQNAYSEVTLTSTGNDPILQLPIKLSGYSEYVLKVVLQAPTQTVFQIFYRNAEKHFNQEQSVRHILKKGPNTFFLHIQDQNELSNIRIDPGAVPGEYTLKELTIRSVQ
jgi:hypothetical protein